MMGKDGGMWVGASRVWRIHGIMCVMGRFIGFRRGTRRICKFVFLWCVYLGQMLTGVDDSKVFISFGGLLLYMQGPYKKLTPLRIDYVYLLVKK